MSHKILTLFILTVLFTYTSFPQERVDISSLSSDYVIRSSREKFINDLDQKVKNIFSGQLNPQSEKNWKSLFREVELANYKSRSAFNAAGTAIKYAQNSNPSFQRATIELIYTLYQNDFFEDVKRIYENTNSPGVFSTASMYLINHFNNPVSKDSIRNMLHSKFPAYESDPILRYLDLDMSADDKRSFSDSLLVELLAHPFQRGKTIIYSFHRINRQYPGITVIKKPDGRFLRESDSTIFHVTQLASSTSQLPGYISQGDTPQGIFSIVGYYISPTESIGPTPIVLTRIPFEVSTEIFYHKEVKSRQWRYEDYKNLLPAGWQNYPWIFESWFAGNSGRKLIVMHGSTDDISFFKNKPYYPLTPSKGCLTTKEIWSEETGKCIESDQAKLMNAFFSTGQLYGFLVVLNLENKNEAVTIDEIRPYILAAESD